MSTRNEGGSPEEWNTPQIGSFWQPPPEPEGPRGAPRFRHCRRAHRRCSGGESEIDRERMTSLAASTPTVVKVWTIVCPRVISAHSLFQARRARQKICGRVRDPISDNLKLTDFSPEKHPKKSQNRENRISVQYFLRCLRLLYKYFLTV